MEGERIALQAKVKMLQSELELLEYQLFKEENEGHLVRHQISYNESELYRFNESDRDYKELQSMNYELRCKLEENIVAVEKIRGVMENIKKEIPKGRERERER